MNTEQICRLAALQGDAVSTSDVLSRWYRVTAELYSWANEGNRKLEKAIRRVQSDYFTTVMASTAATSKILGIDYAPSSLQVVSNTLRYTLPPNFLALKSIRATTTGYEALPFEHRDYAHPDFQAALKVPSTEVSLGGFFYDIIGERTLAIAPNPGATLETEIVYIHRTRPLRRYTTGTVAVTTLTTAVTGTTTIWSDGTPFDPAFADIIFGTSGSSTLPTPDPSEVYDRLSSVTSNTALVLASNRVGTLAAGTGYIISSIPEAPEESHNAIVDWVTYKILGKAKSRAAAFYLDSFNRHIAEIISSTSKRQLKDAEFIEPIELGVPL